MGNLPDVLEASVVMATFNRMDLLPKALGALMVQEDVDFEIVVVDDGSTDGTGSYLARVAGDAPVPMSVVAARRNAGPAVARNLGWRIARSPLIAFTDDDCEPDPRWLRNLVDAAASAAIVQGRTIPNPSDPVTSCWNRAVRAESFSHRFQTCNLAIRRDVLEDVDGFDESYPFAGEDADLGWRARARGHSGVYCPDALVLHALRPLTFLGYLRMRKGWAELTRFHKAHPESRFLLYRGLFHRRQHVTVLAGSLVAVVAWSVVAWWTVPLLYLAYTASIARRVELTGATGALRLKYALFQPVADAWELVHFGLQSIRHRTLVL